MWEVLRFFENVTSEFSGHNKAASSNLNGANSEEGRTFFFKGFTFTLKSHLHSL